MIHWCATLSADQQRAVRDVITAAAHADGVAPVGDQVLRELSSNRTDHLIAEVDGVVVGYLNLTPAVTTGPTTATAMAEAVVHPEHRRRGYGADLIRAGLSRGGDGARIWAHANLAPARAAATALGLVPVRELWRMQRSLAGLPAVPPPHGWSIRTYRGPVDDAEVLRVNNAAFSWHPEQGGWTPADMAERRAEPWFDAEGLFLAVDDAAADTTDGRVLGFHWTKVHGGPGSGAPASGGIGPGEVYVVGVDPSAQGRGLGAVLTLIGLHHLANRLGPDADVILYVEADNSAAVATYRRLDFEVAAADVAYTVG